MELRGKRLLVTGPAGQIAFPLARELARDNEVWGIARFSQDGSRERCEAAGMHTRVVDLEDPDFSGLPDGFDYLLHLAIFQAPGLDYDRALRINAEGTGLLMSRYRDASACLVVSTSGVYEPRVDGGPVVESDPLGVSSQPYSPTYPITKIAQEATARFAARDLGLPTTIARMNVSYGPLGGLPAYQLDLLVERQPIPVLDDRPSICSPIHDDDIRAHVPGLLEAASSPATLVNWGGDEPVDVVDYCRYLGELAGIEPVFERTPDAIQHFNLDPARRRAATGPCKVRWRDGMRRMVAERHPALGLDPA